MEMSEALGREIFYIELWHFLALLVILGVNSWFYHHGEKGPLLFHYLLLQGALLLWVLSKMLKTVSPNESLHWFFIVTQYLGISFLGPLFFIFTWYYLFSRPPSLKFKLLLYGLSLFFFILIATNPLHHLFYATYTFYRDTFGPLFYIFSLFTYTLIAAATLLFLCGIARKQIKGSSGDFLVGFSALLPLLANAVYTYRLFGFSPLFDYTPLFMTCSLVFFGIAAFRSRFLGILPAAWKRLLLELEDPLILVDRKGRLRGVSSLSPGTLPRGEIRQNGKVYRLHRQRSGRRGSIYHYVDVTRVEELASELHEKNRQLESSIEEIRRGNRKTLETLKSEWMYLSSRELHDILGHSLSQVIYLLRMEEQYGGSSTENRAERPDHVLSIITRSLEQLEERLSGRIDEGNITSIALGSLIRQCSLPGVSLDFLLRGHERPLPASVVRELTGCCREALTNSVKHGRPEKIDIVLLYGSRKLALLCVDDGAGCQNCRAGNGLSLMERGLRKIGGSLAFRSEAGEGFQLTLKVPYPPLGGGTAE